MDVEMGFLGLNVSILKIGREPKKKNQPVTPFIPVSDTAKNSCAFPLMVFPSESLCLLGITLNIQKAVKITKKNN